MASSVGPSDFFKTGGGGSKPTQAALDFLTLNVIFSEANEQTLAKQKKEIIAAYKQLVSIKGKYGVTDQVLNGIKKGLAGKVPTILKEIEAEEKASGVATHQLSQQSSSSASDSSRPHGTAVTGNPTTAKPSSGEVEQKKQTDQKEQKEQKETKEQASASKVQKKETYYYGKPGVIHLEIRDNKVYPIKNQRDLQTVQLYGLKVIEKSVNIFQNRIRTLRIYIDEDSNLSTESLNKILESEIKKIKEDYSASLAGKSFDYYLPEPDGIFPLSSELPSLYLQEIEAEKARKLELENKAKAAEGRLIPGSLVKKENMLDITKQFSSTVCYFLNELVGQKQPNVAGILMFRLGNNNNLELALYHKSTKYLSTGSKGDLGRFLPSFQLTLDKINKDLDFINAENFTPEAFNLIYNLLNCVFETKDIKEYSSLLKEYEAIKESKFKAPLLREAVEAIKNAKTNKFRVS